MDFIIDNVPYSIAALLGMAAGLPYAYLMAKGLSNIRPWSPDTEAALPAYQEEQPPTDDQLKRKVIELQSLTTLKDLAGSDLGIYLLLSPFISVFAVMGFGIIPLAIQSGGYALEILDPVFKEGRFILTYAAFGAGATAMLPVVSFIIFTFEGRYVDFMIRTYLQGIDARRLRALRLTAILRRQRPALSNLAPLPNERGPDSVANLYRDLAKICYIFDLQKWRYLNFKFDAEAIAYAGESPDAVIAEMREKAEARVAENENWIFAVGVERFTGFVGLSEKQYFIENNELLVNCWNVESQTARAFPVERLVVANGLPGLNYDLAVAAALDKFYDAGIRARVELRGAPPLSENTRRMLSAYRGQFSQGEKRGQH